jgi:polar amino acid transport system permease protein
VRILLENRTFIADGLLRTLALAAVTLVFSTLIGVLLGVLTVTPVRLLRWLVRGYVELFRDVPLIVSIFFIFFGLPLVWRGVEMTPFVAVTLGLSLWGGANGTEIVRGGLAAVPRQQWESAMALGLRGWQILVFVVAPQAVKAVVPPFTGLLTLLVQATSLGALVGVGEFLRVGQIIVERTTVMEGRSPAFNIYLAVLVVYFLICSALTWLSRRLEARLRADGEPGTKAPGRLALPSAPRYT